MKKCIILGDLQFGNTIDLHALLKIAKLIDDIKPELVIDVGDLVDYFRIYEWQKTHVYSTQAKIAATWLRWLALRANKVVTIPGNHDKRPFGDGLWLAIKQLLPASIEYHDKKEVIVKFGERVILVTHGDFFDGSATLRGPSPMFFTSIVIYIINKWKAGYKSVNTLVVGHIHAPLGFRRYGERGFGEVDPREMLDIVVVPSIQHPRTTKYADRGVAIIPDTMNYYPKLVKMPAQLSDINEDALVIFYAEMLKQYHTSDPDVIAAIEEALKYA